MTVIPGRHLLPLLLAGAFATTVLGIDSDPPPKPPAPADSTADSTTGVPGSSGLPDAQQKQQEETKQRADADLDQYVNKAKDDTDPRQTGQRLFSAHLIEAREGEEARRGRLGNAAGRSPEDVSVNATASDAHLRTRAPAAIGANSYMAPPSRYAIIDASRNQAAGVQSALKRATSWLSRHTCSDFDWTAQFQASFNEKALENWLQDTAKNVIASAPMIILANWNPTLYEHVKHLRAVVGAQVLAHAQSCQAMEAKLGGAKADRLAAGHEDCIKAHQGLTLPEVNKICNSGGSAWLAIDDAMGKLQSVAGAGNKRVNLTDMMLKGLAGNDDDSDDEAEIKQKSDQLIAEKANYEMLKTKLGENAGETKTSAQNIQKLQDDLDAFHSKPSSKSPLRATRRAALDGLRDIIGDLTVDSKASLQIGAQAPRAFELRTQHVANRLGEDLIDQLEQHWNIISQSPIDSVGLNESTRLLHAYFWGCIQVNWKLLYAKNDDVRDFNFDDRTLDRLAALWQRYQNDGLDAEGRRILNDQYGLERFLSQAMMYEVFAFSRDEFKELKQTANAQIQTFLTNNRNNMKDAAAYAEKRLDDHEKMLADTCHRLRGEVAELLPLINSYRRPAAGSDYVGSGHPTLDPLQTPNLAP